MSDGFAAGTNDGAVTLNCYATDGRRLWARLLSRLFPEKGWPPASVIARWPRGIALALLSVFLAIPSSAVESSTIAGSIPTAVDRALAQMPEEDPIVQARRIAELEAQVARIEKVADLTADCVRAAFVWAGSDLVSTAAGRERCPECKEANPLALDSDLALVGLKLGALGTQVAACYTSAKKGEKPAKALTWGIRLIQGIAVVSNGYSAITGKPLWKVK